MESIKNGIVDKFLWLFRVISPWLVLLASIFIVISTVQRCEERKKYNYSLESIKNYKDTVKIYKGLNNELVEYNEVLETNNDALKIVRDSLYKYIQNIKIKEPEVIVETKTITKIDSIPVIKFVNSTNLDTSFSIQNKHYSISGNINTERLALNEILIPNKSTFVIGKKKDKWWKKDKTIITVKNSNPYIVNKGLKSYTLNEDPSRWSIGVSAGYGVYADLPKQTIGHGLIGGLTISYDLIKF